MPSKNVEHEFLEIQKKGQELEKKAIVLETMALATAGNLLSNYVFPSATMHGMKNTETGQKASGSFFEVGIEHGKKNMQLVPSFETGLSTLMNKDIFKDYYYGKQIGEALKDSKKKNLRNDERIKIVYSDMMKRFGNTPEKLNQLKSTPVLGAFYRYMNQDTSSRATKLLRKYSQKTDSSSSNKKNNEQLASKGAVMLYNAVSDPLSIVTKPTTDFLQKKVSQREDASKDNSLLRFTNSVFLSPRIYDDVDLKRFLSEHAQNKKIQKQYSNLPTMISKTNVNLS